MPALLAAISAVAFGIGDFLGGMSARRMAAVLSVAGAQITGFVLLLGLTAVTGGNAGATDLAWGLAAGTAGAFALMLFYWALGAGQMSVVAPTSAIMSALVPIAFGLISGERPSTVALLGVALALPAIVLIAREPRDPRGEEEQAAPPRRRAVVAASLLSGLGFGGFFVCISRSAEDSGLWPLATARGTAVLIVGVATLVLRPGRPNRPGLRLAAVAGIFDVSANALFVVAARQGLLTLVGAIGAMYPASTVVLARFVLKERMARHQLLGLGLAGVSLIAVTAG